MVSNGPGAGFYYKGDIYIKGTIIKLKDEYIKKRAVQGEKIWKYAKYMWMGDPGRFVFNYCKMDYNYDLPKMGYTDPEERRRIPKEHVPIFGISGWEMEEAIEEIVRRETLPREITEIIMENIADPKTYETKGSGILCAIYVAVMIGSLIFNQFYIVWIVATILFLLIKKGMES